MEQRACAEAADRFEKALELHLFEQPNYKLLSRLALARFRAGDHVRANIAMESAELALSVLAGVVRCIETKEGFELIKASGRHISSSQRDAVRARMCGAAYDGYYVRPKLETFLRDADLIRYFFEVKSEIDPRTPKAEE